MHRSRSDSRLLCAIREPQSLQHFSIGEWDDLLQEARHTKLLGYLSYLVEDEGLQDCCPPPALDILEAARQYPAFLQTRARREIRQVLRALEPESFPLILLKGAAYAAAALPLARGRLLSDADILVRRSDLGEIEQRLRNQGWELQKLDSYDQRYYREWMHEIPPLKHAAREFEIDVHHALLPITARLHPDPTLLWEASFPLTEGPLRILAPADMVLHSAAHLFYDGAIDGSLRDLVDLHQLMAGFGAEPDFWANLLDRAQALELGRPLYYALHFCRELLGTDIPKPVLRHALNRHAPNPLVRRLMDKIVRRVLTPRLPGEAGTPLSAWLLYVRSHWLRMPPLLLASHLSRKTWRRIWGAGG